MAPNAILSPMRLLRAFSLIEAMVVVGIVGIGASMAMPAFNSFVAHARAQETFRSALKAVADGRALAQRTNGPVRVTILAKSIVIEQPIMKNNDTTSVRRSVMGYDNASARTIPIDGGTFESIQFLDAVGAVTSTVRGGEVGAFLIFCASSESYYREDTPAALPVCGTGNLASAEAKIILKAQGETQHVRVRRALGAIDLKAGG